MNTSSNEPNNQPAPSQPSAPSVPSPEPNQIPVAPRELENPSDDPVEHPPSPVVNS